MQSFLKKECDLQFFHTNGFIRKQCPHCKDFFWTINPSMNFCGDQPCVPFSFINKPLGTHRLSLSDVREHFLSYFEQHGHSRLQYPETGPRCPVIARWRSDIYLTIASIANFQPHVTSGEIPAPANPLVISQPCIRLNDLEEIGVSGRHLSMFEMMGHHAFNKDTDEIYWKEDTVLFCDEFFQKKIGIPREQITYKEQLWDGGGNAGPCLEVLAGGLEIATLVFMNMRADPKGSTTIKETTYSANPLNIVDTGYGLERIAWATQGTTTVYETVFPKIITFIKNNTTKTTDMQSIYALADHSKCLAFMLGDGIVPSNVKAGYLARLMIRRSLRFLEKLHISVSLGDIVALQLDELGRDFPSLRASKKQIHEILQIETRRFSDTLIKGESLIKRSLKEKGKIETNDLIYFYDTHGMPPDVVQRVADKEGVHVEIPPTFDSMIAQLHSHEKAEETQEEDVSHLPATKQLYYQDHYLKEFEATVLWTQQTSQGCRVVLNQTAFYPEGGGQPGDIGVLSTKTAKISVTQVEKQGNAIVHILEKGLNVGDRVQGIIDWDHRYTLMKHHTGTHVVNAALRSLFGEHIWQAGSQLDLDEARFDFSHYKSISDDEKKEIERIANKLVQKGAPVEKKVLPRNEAERLYGFRLYQGGVPPGNEIRVIHIPKVDVEACGGTHLNNIKEIEKIRIIKTERIQDGVNRVVFAAGSMADLYESKEEALFSRIMQVLEPRYVVQSTDHKADTLFDAAKLFSVSVDQLETTLTRFVQELPSLKKKTVVCSVKDACEHVFEEWKKIQKQKKKVSSDDVEQLQNQAEAIPGTSVRVVIAVISTDSVATAGAIIQKPGFVVHLYDGAKLTSAASDDVDIDLRTFAAEIGRILGGSGGGKPKMTQCGGPKKQQAQEALETAKKRTIQMVSQKQT